MNAPDERYTWIILSIVASSLLAALVFSLGPAGWAAPGYNPYRQTVPTPFTPTAWVYLPQVVKEYPQVFAGGVLESLDSIQPPYLPLALRGE